jgi:hypothetical protein
LNTDNLKVRDIIFPLILVEQIKTGACKMKEFLGTGFLIGSEGYALTAAHVVDVKIELNQAIVALFIDKKNNKWKIFNADKVDIHPTEDVAVLKMRDGKWYSTDVRVNFEMQFASFEYQLFGYPSINLYEEIYVKDQFGKVLGRPDLIYSKGHIRRRISFNLPAIKGNCFYELSEPIGAGCSGSPLFRLKNGIWEVIGIYIADKTENIVFEGYDKNLNWIMKSFEVNGSLSYAVRMDDLKNWQPKSLNKTLDQIT